MVIRSRELADLLAGASGAVAELAGRIAVDWPDARGAEWAQRTTAAHRELERAVSAAWDLVAALSRRGAAESRPGVRLADTAAERVDEERGMRLARLDEPSGRPGGDGG